MSIPHNILYYFHARNNPPEVKFPEYLNKLIERCSTHTKVSVQVWIAALIPDTIPAEGPMARVVGYNSYQQS